MDSIFDFAENYGIKMEHIVFSLAVMCFVMLVTVIILLVLQLKMKKRYNKFMSGKDAKSLEEELLNKIAKINSFNKDIDVINSRLSTAEDALEASIQKIGVVKYDAFKEMGGKLSFAVALLTAENTGIVINSMHSREGCYTYVKEIIKGESFVMLADEEKKAIQEAMKSRDYMEQVG